MIEITTTFLINIPTTEGRVVKDEERVTAINIVKNALKKTFNLSEKEVDLITTEIKGS